MLELLHAITDVLRGTLGSPWLWVVVFLVSALDAILPFMPSETTVVTVAVLIGPDLPKLALLAAIAAGGALAGDCLSYWFGHRSAPAVLARMQRTERGQQRYEWARARVDKHAPLLITAGRYLPGGRVASGLACGSLHFPWRRFVALDALGAGIWAVYSTVIGYIGGASFADEPAKGLLLSFGIALFIVTAIEVGRRLRMRLRSRRGSREIPPRAGLPLQRSAHSGRVGRSRRPGADVSEVDGQQTGEPSGEGAVLGACGNPGSQRAERETGPPA